MNSVPVQLAADPRLQARRLFSDPAAALFDLDNTLIETHIDFPKMKRAMLALAERYGLDPELLVPLDILGVVEAVCQTLHAARCEPDAARFRAEAFAQLAEIEAAECANPVELEGAAELLAALRERNVPVAIVTRNCRAVAEQLIAFGRLHCEALLAREDVVRVKPHPDHLRDALTALQPHREESLLPAACVMVGDHWMDVAAGRAAGMRTVGVRRNRPTDFFAEAMPDLLVNDMAELWALVRDGS